MHRRRHSKAPQYLVNCCTPVTDAVGTQKPHSRTATDGGATPSAIHCWMPSIRCARPHGRKLLAGDLRAQQNHESFKQGLKTWLKKPPDTSVFSALDFRDNSVIQIDIYHTIPYRKPPAAKIKRRPVRCMRQENIYKPHDADGGS